MTHDPFRQLLALVNRLQQEKIAYKLRHSRDDALMVQVNVPGQRWEIEFVDYGDEVQIEVERFSSDGTIVDETAIEELFAKLPDAEHCLELVYAWIARSE